MAEDVYKNFSIGYVEFPIPTTEDVQLAQVLTKNGVSYLWNAINNKFVRIPEGGVDGQMLIKQSNRIVWGDPAISVVSKDDLDIELKLLLGLTSISDVSAEDFLEMISGKSVDEQTSLLQYIDSEVPSSWSFSSQLNILNSLDESLRGTFFSKMSFQSATLQDMIDIHDDYPNYRSSLIGKTVALDVGSEQGLEFQIVGVDHDDLSDGSGKARLSFMSLKIVEYCTSSTSNNYSNCYWTGSTYPPYSLSQEWYNKFNSEDKALIKQVKKKYNKQRSSTVQYWDGYIWIPSLNEVTKKNTSPDTIDDGPLYDYYSSDSDNLRVKEPLESLADEENTSWWVRSVAKSGDSVRVIRIASSGGPYIESASTSMRIGLVIGFCV